MKIWVNYFPKGEDCQTSAKYYVFTILHVFKINSCQNSKYLHLRNTCCFRYHKIMHLNDDSISIFLELKPNIDVININQSAI